MKAPWGPALAGGAAVALWRCGAVLPDPSTPSRAGRGATRGAGVGARPPPTFDREHVLAWKLRDLATWDSSLPRGVDLVYCNGTVHGEPLMSRANERR